MSITGTIKLVQKSIVDLENYRLNKTFLLSLLITLASSLTISYLGYIFFSEFLISMFNFESKNIFIKTIVDSYYFYILIITLKILFGFTLFAIILVPIGSITAAFFADVVFDKINMKNILIFFSVLIISSCAIQSSKTSNPEKINSIFSFSEKYVGLEQNNTYQ